MDRSNLGSYHCCCSLPPNLPGFQSWRSCHHSGWRGYQETRRWCQGRCRPKCVNTTLRTCSSAVHMWMTLQFRNACMHVYSRPFVCKWPCCISNCKDTSIYVIFFIFVCYIIPALSYWFIIIVSTCRVFAVTHINKIIYACMCTCPFVQLSKYTELWLDIDLSCLNLSLFYAPTRILLEK